MEPSREVSAEEFLNALKSARCWNLSRGMFIDGRYRLVFANDNGVHSYYGPNPATTKLDEYAEYLQQLNEIIRQQRTSLAEIAERQSGGKVEGSRELLAEEFLSELKSAKSWNLTQDMLTERHRLIVTNDSGMHSFYGPSPVTMKSGEYAEYLQQIEEITSNPDIQGRMRW